MPARAQCENENALAYPRRIDQGALGSFQSRQKKHHGSKIRDAMVRAGRLPSDLRAGPSADGAVVALATEGVLLDAHAHCAGDGEPLSLAEHVAAEDAHGTEAESDVLLPVGDVAGQAEHFGADEVGIGHRHGHSDTAVELAELVE